MQNDLFTQFGCRELDARELKDIQGGGYIGDLITVVKAGYFLTKGFAVNVPLAGPLAVSLLTAFVDPVVNAA
ncbi:hypothetical protein [Chitinophaga cymbidii]|uniref:Uncharacterized protein n=1 Tax=Chitinophaga cymbidii TaxID=1096750 RepID=A0A512RQG2_9BACT|nr:hypothetical protein [Chitinophaga cymbidii]GEP97927.1 hypothetical protein CCY01nite_41870 [Chitinophaga cymbidii]